MHSPLAGIAWALCMERAPSLKLNAAIAADVFLLTVILSDHG
jgi:hypothetical protein